MAASLPPMVMAPVGRMNSALQRLSTRLIRGRDVKQSDEVGIWRRSTSLPYSFPSKRPTGYRCSRTVDGINYKTAKPAKRLKTSSPDLLLDQALSSRRTSQAGFRDQVQSQLQFCVAQCILDSSYGLAFFMPPFVNQIPPKCYFLSQFSFLFCHSMCDDCQTDYDYIQRNWKFPDRICNALYSISLRAANTY